MPQSQASEHMTVAQVAEMFGVNVKSVLDWIYAGKLPGARKIDPTRRTSAYLIPTEEVLAFKKERDQPKKG